MKKKQIAPYVNEGTNVFEMKLSSSIEFVGYYCLTFDIVCPLRNLKFHVNCRGTYLNFQSPTAAQTCHTILLVSCQSYQLFDMLEFRCSSYDTYFQLF